MKKLKLLTLIFSIFILTSTIANARYDYIRPLALGMRASPNGFGFNARYYIHDRTFLEAQHAWSKGTPNGSGKCLMNGLLIHYNFPIAGPYVRLYFGIGAHYGTWARFKDKSLPVEMFGFDGAVGTEAIFPASNIGVSVDFKPAFNNVPIAGVTFMPNNTLGLGVRYYFGRWRQHSRRWK